MVYWSVSATLAGSVEKCAGPFVPCLIGEFVRVESSEYGHSGGEIVSAVVSWMGEEYSIEFVLFTMAERTVADDESEAPGRTVDMYVSCAIVIDECECPDLLYC